MARLREMAQEAFERAVELDSTFALAWYRLAKVYEWLNTEPRATRTVRRAQRCAEQLSARDRLGLAALRATIEGNYVEAERRYLDVLEQHPDGVEALVGLGMVTALHAAMYSASCSRPLPLSHRDSAHHSIVPRTDFVGRR